MRSCRTLPNPRRRKRGQHELLNHDCWKQIRRWLQKQSDLLLHKLIGWLRKQRDNGQYADHEPDVAGHGHASKKDGHRHRARYSAHTSGTPSNEMCERIRFSIVPFGPELRAEVNSLVPLNDSASAVVNVMLAGAEQHGQGSSRKTASVTLYARVLIRREDIGRFLPGLV